MEEAVYKTIVDISGGDLRRAITTLQSCQRLKGLDTAITTEDLLEISGVIPDKYLQEFLDVCKSGNYSKLEEFVQNLTYEAYSIGQMLEQFNEFVLSSAELNNQQKSIICDKLGVK